MTKLSRKTYNKNHNIKDGASNVQSEKEKCIRQILNNAEPELVNMILQQSKNITRKPNGHRWSKEFIGTCLQIFNKSPNAYDTLINSKILLLPSKSTLIIYRNKIKQEPGINSENIEWVFNEANKQQLKEESRQGGIVFDEMAIQCDLQIDKKGDSCFTVFVSIRYRIPIPICSLYN